MLKAVLPFTMARFGRAIVMPNLSPNPIVTTDELIAYRDRILREVGGAAFTPLMTYYMTEQTDPDDIARGKKEGLAYAVKMYPANATTNSSHGVTNVETVYPVLSRMEELGMPVLLHGETVLQHGVEIPAKDREKVFLDSALPKLLKDFPALKIVLEHATTKDAVDFIRNEQSARLASTITLHHLWETDTDVERAEKPAFHHCMPVIKSETDRRALRDAATSGESYFFLGTDSAPHPLSAKEKIPPAAGIFTAPAALEMYAQVFDEEGRLENLESFASLNGARFYDLQPNDEMLTLVRKPWNINTLIEVEDGERIRPFGFEDDPSAKRAISWAIRA